MHKLYPPLKPNRQFWLKVEEPHELYVEESGNADGIPVVFLHGGPGAGCEDKHRSYFDPNLFRIILFDQRGAGKSRPHAELTNNTTPALVDDIERIRVELGIDRWLVFGGSWGSTLALVYAETHPERVMGLVLRGIFLCRPSEIRWFYQEGANRLFPDYWLDFISPIPDNERHDLLHAHYRRLTGDDEVARMRSAEAWSVWEGRTATLTPRKEVVDFFSDPHVALALSRIEAHYFVNHIFLDPNQILREAYRLKNIPGIIIHGRYDIVCPVENAWDLHLAWPDSKLEIIPDAGHSASEPGIVNALIQATQDMHRQISG